MLVANGAMWLNIGRMCSLNIERGVIERVKPLPLRVVPAPSIYCEKWTGSGGPDYR